MLKTIEWTLTAWEHYIYWSRRIDDTNRLTYAVSDKKVTIIACRY
jgi:Txe/YoeB family toxin of Txe-Axe toxin-antitoxin module